MGGRLAGKKALIYGGGTGIGLACAQAIAEEGAKVVVSGRRSSVLLEALRGLKAKGPAASFAGDATIADDVRRVTDQAAQFMGGMDTIVVSAGAGGKTPVLEASVEQFRHIVEHSIVPTFLAIRFGASHLLAAGAGSVIVIASMSGLVGVRERAAYCAGKFGVIGLVKSAALDLADKGVRVNAICPGFVETDMSIGVAHQEADPQAAIEARRRMHPIPRPGKLEEMGELAVYLASDLSAFVTGQAIAIDGGYTAR